MAARLFLALWPDAAIRAELAAQRDRWRWPRAASPVHKERLHLTLHFIGAVPEERVGEVADALQVPFTPFDLDLTRPALWPHGVAVLEPDSVPAALPVLQLALATPLHALGLPVEARTYRPHVTMARRAAGTVVPDPGPPVHWPVRQYALVRSQPDAYVVVRAYGS